MSYTRIRFFKRPYIIAEIHLFVNTFFKKIASLFNQRDAIVLFRN